MKFTIVTASFNSERSIGDCISSVLRQTFSDIEHVVVDGGSEDNTVNVIRSLPNRVAKIIPGPDKGIYDAIIQKGP